MNDNQIALLLQNAAQTSDPINILFEEDYVVIKSLKHCFSFRKNPLGGGFSKKETPELVFKAYDEQRLVDWLEGKIDLEQWVKKELISFTIDSHVRDIESALSRGANSACEIYLSEPTTRYIKVKRSIVETLLQIEEKIKIPKIAYKALFVGPTLFLNHI